jgi:HEAT repeat protein
MLGAVDDPAATATLASLAAAPGSVLVRANAARALGSVGGSEEAMMLANVVSSDAPLRVRQEAALALARIGGRDQVPQLVSALNESQDEQLRISIIQALGALDEPLAREAITAHANRSLSPAERAFVRQAQRKQPQDSGTPNR